MECLHKLCNKRFNNEIFCERFKDLAEGAREVQWRFGKRFLEIESQSRSSIGGAFR